MYKLQNSISSVVCVSVILVLILRFGQMEWLHSNWTEQEIPTSSASDQTLNAIFGRH